MSDPLDNTQPNDPRVFQRLIDALVKLHAASGETMYFVCRDDDDTASFMQNYPFGPTEMYGQGDAVEDAAYLAEYPVREDPHVTVVEAGTRASFKVEDELGRRLSVGTCLLNSERQRQYGRIGEAHITQLDDDPEGTDDYDAVIFWFEADGRAWRRPFFDYGPRQQMNDMQLERLALLVEGSVT